MQFLFGIAVGLVTDVLWHTGEWVWYSTNEYYYGHCLNTPHRC